MRNGRFAYDAVATVGQRHSSRIFLDTEREDGQALGLCYGKTPDQADYTFDPLNPVATLWSRNLYSEPGNRRRLEHRRDILRYRTPQLTESREVGGETRAVLFISCSTPDTDLFARLVDEPPEGRRWK